MPRGHSSRIINNSLQWLIGTECYVYIDDIVIFSDTFESFLIKLKHVLERRKKLGFTIQPVKCIFVELSTYYLEHIISEEGLFPMANKLEIIKIFPVPTNMKDIQSFSALCGYYKKFIKNFAEKAKPLNNLLRNQKEKPFC